MPLMQFHELQTFENFTKNDDVNPVSALAGNKVRRFPMLLKKISRQVFLISQSVSSIDLGTSHQLRKDYRRSKEQHRESTPS